ncbi:integrase [Salinibacter ruber]|uniref:tyrosine-type recombinase/integrase n=1 Tax=Salinibacter ruber TaxID=146919 RepID=UPI0021671D48|nr:tyrosine-type recombinase/integrase [Salinibacter ruber]MCS4190717.1 integrase [Salinibacter ruber]
MANLRKIDGSYYAYFYDPNGSPKRKSHPLRVHMKSTAEDKLKRLEKAHAEGRFDPWREDPWIEKTDQVLIQDAIDQFLDYKKKTVQPTTIDTYRQQLEAWAKQMPMTYHVLDVQPRDARNYVYDSDIANATRRKRYRHLDVFLGWCDGEEYLDENPIDRVQKPRKEERETPVLDPSDVEKLLDKIDEHRATTTDATGRRPDVQWLKDAIVIAMYTGLRRGELVSLKWADVDLDSKRISVRNRGDFRTKTGDERSVPLRGKALDQLREIKSRRGEVQQTKPVLADQKGDPIRPDRATKRFKEFVRMANLDERICLHSLRHSCVSLLSRRGVSTRIIQKIVGHSSITTTERYSHIRVDEAADAMEDAFDTR